MKHLIRNITQLHKDVHMLHLSVGMHCKPGSAANRVFILWATPPHVTKYTNFFSAEKGFE